jgi:hypothetical protein
MCMCVTSKIDEEDDRVIEGKRPGKETESMREIKREERERERGERDGDKQGLTEVRSS